MHEDCALFLAQNTGNVVVPDECIHKREADYARLSLPFRNLRASRSKQVDCLPRNGKKRKAFRALFVQVFRVDWNVAFWGSFLVYFALFWPYVGFMLAYLGLSWLKLPNLAQHGLNLGPT